MHIRKGQLMQNINIIVEVMQGKEVTIVAKSKSSDEIWRLRSSLKKLNPEVRTNCNEMILPGNVSQLIVQITLVKREDWVEGALREALEQSKSIITTSSI